MMNRGRVAHAVAALVTAASAILHFIFWGWAGAYWRDELISLRLATSPTLAIFRERLPFDSFPALWPLLLRMWLATGADVRLLGFLAGLLTLLALWAASRMVGASVPILALSLLGISAAVVRYGDSIRGYGIGNVCALLAAGWIGRAVMVRSARAWQFAAALAILAVQATYFNAVLIFACCAAASFTMLIKSCWREAWTPLAAGGAAALSLLPYVNVLRERAVWSIAGRENVTLATYLSVLAQTLAHSGSAALVVFAVVITGAVLTAAARRLEAVDLYCLSLSAIFLIGHFAFVRTIGYFPHPWHYLSLVVIVAWCADVLLRQYDRSRIAIALIAGVLAVPSASMALRQHQTNADTVAAFVAARAVPGDAVVIYPWYCAVSFVAYYRGPARWIVLPPLADPAGQRYDQYLAAGPESVLPVIATVEAAFRSGHRVWLVGFPLNRSLDRPTQVVWASALAAALHRGSSQRRLVLRGDASVSSYERMEVGLFTP